MIFNNSNHVKNLPDVYDKKTTSNNYKILELERQTLVDIRDDLNDVQETLDVDEAYGKTLDLYGEIVGQQRGVADDNQYLAMIKSKIMQNYTDGTYSSVVNSICLTFDCEPSEIQIVENQAPCTVDFVSLPLNAITRSHLTATQMVAILKRLMPICITVDTILFEGTFEFSTSESEYDANAGFCDVEGGTLGGYLGMMYGEENEPILPI